MSALTHPSLGFGLGLRTQHYEAVVNDRAGIDWVEVLTDNYLRARRQAPHLPRSHSRAVADRHAWCRPFHR